jgi:hypothetical protein
MAKHTTKHGRVGTDGSEELSPQSSEPLAQRGRGETLPLCTSPPVGVLKPANTTTRGIHSKPNNGLSNEWLTPPYIIEALGTFSLDPCAHPQQFYRTANHMITPPADGLASEWKGRVWLNPPYGAQLPKWLHRLAWHGDGIALVPSRTDVEKWFWPYVWEAADALLFLRGRLYFHRPDGSTEGNAGHGSVLAAYGQKNVDALKASGINGRFFHLKNQTI